MVTGVTMQCETDSGRCDTGIPYRALLVLSHVTKS